MVHLNILLQSLSAPCFHCHVALKVEAGIWKVHSFSGILRAHKGYWGGLGELVLVSGCTQLD